MENGSKTRFSYVLYINCTLKKLVQKKKKICFLNVYFYYVCHEFNLHSSLQEKNLSIIISVLPKSIWSWRNRLLCSKLKDRHILTHIENLRFVILLSWSCHVISDNVTFACINVIEW